MTHLPYKLYFIPFIGLVCMFLGACEPNTIRIYQAPAVPMAEISLETPVDVLLKSCFDGSISACSALMSNVDKWHSVNELDKLHVSEQSCKLDKKNCAFYGRMLAFAGRIDEARRICAGTCSSAAWNPEGCFCLGIIATYDADYSGAQQIYEVGCAGGNFQLCLMVGEAKLTLGDFEGAAATFRQLCTQGDSRSPYACLSLARVELHWEDYEGAMGHLRQATIAGIRDASRLIALVHGARGEWNDAEGVLQTQCSTNRDAQSCLMHGALKFRLGELGESKLAFADACNLDQRLCGFSANFERIFDDSSSNDVLPKARRACESHNENACHILAYMEAVFGDREAAVRTAEQSCRRNFWSSCGLLALLSGRLEESDYEVARLGRMCDRNQPQACAALGEIHLHAQRVEESERAALKACNLDRTSCSLLAIVKLKKGNKDGAKREFLRACQHGNWCDCVNYEALGGKGLLGGERKARAILQPDCKKALFTDLHPACATTRHASK